MAAPVKDGKVCRHRVMVFGTRYSGAFDTKAQALARRIPPSSATALGTSKALSMYKGLSMLPVATLIWPITHGATMSLVMPTLLIMAIPAAHADGGNCALGMAQKIGSAEKIGAVASDSSANAADCAQRNVGTVLRLVVGMASNLSWCS